MFQISVVVSCEIYEVNFISGRNNNLHDDTVSWKSMEFSLRFMGCKDMDRYEQKVNSSEKFYFIPQYQI
jgi:hypothetical protein